MTVYDLNREMLISVKQAYISELDNEGIFGDIVYGDETIIHPSYGDYINADILIPDHVIFEHYEDTHFTPDDFIMIAS